MSSGTAIFLISIPAVFAMAWAAGRLLGTRHSWVTTVLSGVTGWIAGLVFSLFLHNGNTRAGGFGIHLWLFSLVFTMTALAAFDMFARPGALARAQAGVSIPRPLRALRRRSQRVNRYAQLTRILIKNGLGAYVGIGARNEDHQVEGRAPFTHRVSHALDEAGGMFVKLGQVLSTRPDLLPAGLVIELSRLQDNAHPAPRAGIQALIEEELGAPVDAIFAEFDWKAVAAASIGQAHRAVLKTGEPVVVKVQRPGIAALVDRDLDVLLQLARTIEARTAWGSSYQVFQFASDFADRVREELDFRIEARNATDIAKSLATTPAIHIPNVHAEVSTSRVLVMEWLDGVNVRDSQRIDELGLDRRQLADALLRSCMQQMLIDGHFHADPHPGNVMVLRDGRMALIDFGAASRLDALQMSSLRAMLVAINRRDAGQLQQAVLEIATLRRRFDEEQFERALARFIARRLGPGAVPNAAMLNDLMQLFFTFGITLPPEFGTLFRALITLEGTLTILCPGYFVIDEAQKLAKEWAGEQLTAGSMRELVTKEALSVAPILRRLPRHVDRIATMIERGNLSGRVSLFTDPDDVRVLTRLVNRFILAFIGTVGGIISILFIGTPGGPHFTGDTSLYQFFGYFGLFWCLVLVLRVVVAILHDGVN